MRARLRRGRLIHLLCGGQDTLIGSCVTHLLRSCSPSADTCRVARALHQPRSRGVCADGALIPVRTCARTDAAQGRDCGCDGPSVAPRWLHTHRHRVRLRRRPRRRDAVSAQPPPVATRSTAPADGTRVRLSNVHHTRLGVRPYNVPLRPRQARSIPAPCHACAPLAAGSRWLMPARAATTTCKRRAT